MRDFHVRLSGVPFVMSSAHCASLRSLRTPPSHSQGSARSGGQACHMRLTMAPRCHWLFAWP